MVLAWLAGAALGSASGVALGCAFVHRLVKIEPVDYLTAVDISADDKDDIPMPQTAGKAVDVFQRQLLKDLSPWLTHPDYDRVLFINTVLEILWPHLSPAIHKMAVEQAKVPLADACKMAGGLLQEIRIDRLDLGTRPPRVDCFKSYETGEDELIVEAPAFWGGDIQLRVTAVVKAGTRTIDVPVDIANIQFKALSRITVKPLVDTLPCLGGVTLSLLETPHFNMDLRIGDSWDLMALPLVPTLVGTAIKVVAGKLLVYPNEFAYPLMPNFGLPPPPSGMLHVKVIGAKGLKGSMFDRMDAFVRLEVRKGRPVKTKVIPNNESPTWNEEFDFVVDNAAEQGLSLVLKDDDLLGASTEGVAVVPLQGAEFIARPRTPITLTVALRAPMDKSKSKRHNAAVAADGEGTGGSSSAAATPSTGVSPRTLAGDGGTPGSTAGSEKKKKKGFFNKGLAKLKFKKRPSETPGEAAEQAVADAVGGVLAGEGPPHGHGNSPDALQAAAEQPPAVQKAREVAEATPLATPGLELPAGALTGATVTVQCTYFPFKEAQSEGVSESQEGATASITSVRRTLVTTTQPDLTAKGVLTVNLTKCSGLEAAPDTYAVVTLYDPHRLPIPNIEYRSEVVVNEDCPRYNFLCDFVNVSAASTLTAAIYEKAGTLDALKSLKLPFVSKANDKLLGKVRILVEEVAKEGRIRDLWPLQGAQTGDVHLGLEWNPATVAQAGAGTTPPGVV